MSRRSQKSGLQQFKVECARDLDINLKQGYNGDLTSKQAGSIGGEMVKRMILSYEEQAKNNQQ
ncbi:small, acid-soluble spore protein, alpha/beta type [Alkalibaculum sp. M08DMB]|uniref:Small, acid-soluble spore protein, alpha/beta type n=1 Tax=Alkalibaculum sporogenes TaxID=2655001 RepID=A0A6A7K775_9FIRM|nr:alpha/beta-type small acid-soluble spore protein [Alkalibaculum sporogenes]MPW25212.1 small, acid-soluble spore protein, alpha/beta type [Alkalibaculum sporogenes]